MRAGIAGAGLPSFKLFSMKGIACITQFFRFGVLPVKIGADALPTDAHQNISPGINECHSDPDKGVEPLQHFSKGRDVNYIFQNKVSIHKVLEGGIM
jgi:hypothetical protein